MGRGESLEVLESEPLQCSEYQFKPPQEMTDRQWSNHQRDSRCVREKIQMAYERVDRHSQTDTPVTTGHGCGGGGDGDGGDGGDGGGDGGGYGGDGGDGGVTGGDDGK